MFRTWCAYNDTILHNSVTKSAISHVLMMFDHSPLTLFFLLCPTLLCCTCLVLPSNVTLGCFFRHICFHENPGVSTILIVHILKNEAATWIKNTKSKHVKTQLPDLAEHCSLKETQARVLRTAPKYHLHVEVGAKVSRPLFWKFHGCLKCLKPYLLLHCLALAPLLGNLRHT